MGTNALINKPAIPEMCDDEIKDFILELIQRELRSRPAGERSRCQEICEGLLAVNRETGERAKMRDAACDALKDWKAQDEQIASLERLGFTITKGKKHYKLRWNNSEYFKTMSATPSDYRSSANGISEFVGKFF